MMPPASRASVIFNPSSGGGRGQAVAALVERGLANRGLDVGSHATQAPGDATALAGRLAPQSDVIVAVGGDGTINEIVNGMAAAGVIGTAGVSPRVAPQAAPEATLPSGHRCLLGVVPAGTVNVFAVELGLPRVVGQACAVIAAGRTRSLDLGKVNGHRFTLMAGAGIDALTVRNIDPRAKKRFRELAFVGAGLTKGLTGRPPEFLVRVDDNEYHSTFFVAGNCRYYTSRLSMTPDADPADGILDLMLFAGTTRASLLAFWAAIPTGLHVRNPDATWLRATRAELLPLRDDDTVWVQTDGEPAGRLPAVVEIESHALEVLVP
jgi:diacylglycerol kinase family enzyme